MPNKYVCTKIDKLETILIFPDYVGHDEYVRMISKHKEEILGAGFISISDNEEHTKCYGESISLGIKSRGVDTMLLQMHTNRKF